MLRYVLAFVAGFLAIPVFLLVYSAYRNYKDKKTGKDKEFERAILKAFRRD
jgi:amino acid permease